MLCQVILGPFREIKREVHSHFSLFSKLTLTGARKPLLFLAFCLEEADMGRSVFGRCGWLVVTYHMTDLLYSSDNSCDIEQNLPCKEGCLLLTKSSLSH